MNDDMKLKATAMVDVDEWNKLQEDAKLWEKRCLLAWQVQDNDKKEYEDKYDIQNNSLVKLEIEKAELKYKVEELQAEVNEWRTAHEALLLGMPKLNDNAFSHTDLEIELLEGECEKLRAENKLYFRMLERLLKQIAELEDELDA